MAWEWVCKAVEAMSGQNIPPVSEVAANRRFMKRCAVIRIIVMLLQIPEMFFKVDNNGMCY